jgi:hypothetical protein
MGGPRIKRWPVRIVMSGISLKVLPGAKMRFALIV